MINAEKYKKSMQNIAPSRKLIDDTIAKIAERKKSRARIMRLFVQTASAACICLFIGVLTKIALPTNPGGEPGMLVGSIFGEFSYIALPIILFALLMFIFIFLYRRDKK